MHDYYSDWDMCNLNETAFLHSTDPASVMGSYYKEKYVVHWSPDRRTNIIGYNLYVSDYCDTNFVKYNEDPITSTYYLLPLSTDDKLLLIKSIHKSGCDLDYSYIYSLSDIDRDFGFFNYRSYLKPIGTTDTSKDQSFTSLTTIYGNVNIDSLVLLTMVKRDWFNFSCQRVHMETHNINVFLCSTVVHLPLSHKTGFAFQYRMYYKNNMMSLPRDTFEYFTTNINNRIRNPQYGWYAMNVLNPVWITHYINECQKILQRGYTGIFADDAVRDIVWRVDVIPPGINEEYWSEKLYTMLVIIKNHISPAFLIYNGLKSDMYFITAADGGLIEHFAHTLKGFVSTETWIEQVNTLISVPNDKKIFVIARGEESDVKARIFSLASFLIAASNNTFYCYTRKYGVAEYYPECSINIGTPVNTLSSINEIYHPSYGVYIRRYSNGLVVVNPDKGMSASISLDTRMYKAGINNDQVSFTVNDGPLIVPPQSAIILLHEPN
jgi:hypothetical protein